MAITYKELKRAIRFKIKDNSRVRFSDYDIKDAVNEALRYFSNAYALQNSDFLEKIWHLDEQAMNRELVGKAEEGAEVILYDFRNTGVKLPEDFVALQGIVGVFGEPLHPVEGIKRPGYDQYKVVGDTIYLGVPSADVLYKASLGQVRDDESVVEVPLSFKDSLVKTAVMILENNASTDVLMEAVNDAASSLVSRRRYVNARMKMPFYC